MASGRRLRYPFAVSADIVNLNQFRKQRDKARKSATVEENRAKFGRTKQERRKDDATRDKADKSLDGKKLDDDQEKPA